ncbi:hypothetical protein ACP4OV_024223 [Aristida adscensionis]
MGSSSAAVTKRAALVAFAVVAAVFLANASVVIAGRPAPASGGEAEATAAAAAAEGYLAMYPAVVERARETVDMLLARLPAGPSPKGPGH